jgi:hypothetical protein
VVHITISGAVANLEVQGLDKLWALKSRLEIPLAHITGARADPEVARGWWHGVRMPGTNVPGVLTAGTFYEHGRRVFWDVHNPEQTIVIELRDDRYDELIIEVADPNSALRLLHASIGQRTA